ncbi:MAG: TPM domain-containing protein [Cytophagales bacterium]|nr:MAG: TPM domain-containing protein [Cytophagales bacterium]
MIKTFFTEDEQKKIVAAIQEAELATSGEVRVHLEGKCKAENVLDRAAEVFAKLKMHKTELRNGVLFYLAVENKKFAILGDIGINKAVEADFWDKIKNTAIQKFKENKMSEGLCDGIIAAGTQLKKHFPYQSNDINELPDEISFGEN